MPTIEEVNAWEGQDAYGPDAEKIGEIADIYLDQDTGRAEWVTLKTGMLGSVKFAPLGEARADGDHIQLGYDKDTIKDAPKVDADDELAGEEVADLYRFYGVDYYESPADAGMLQGERAEPEYPMTRSESDLRTDGEPNAGGRGRLRRHFATDRVAPERHDEARMERDPITDANRDQTMVRGDDGYDVQPDRRR